MSRPSKSAAARVAATIAVVAVSGLGLTGTALAATPSGMPAAAAIGQRPPPPPPRHYHQRFRSQQQCIAFAQHDRNPRTHGWDCRHGVNRAMPWEYWY